MDAKLFAQMLADKDLADLRKLQYKYSPEAVAEMLALMKDSMFTSLPLRDFAGRPILLLESVARVHMNAVKLLLTPEPGGGAYGVQAMTDEIYNTMRIENIDSSRDSIRRILNGYAPANESENRILGMKRGLEFICDRRHDITEQNLHTLYQLVVGDYLAEGDRLLPGALYRHDRVYVVGGKVMHEGLSHEKLPSYMGELVAFIRQQDAMDDLLKAAVIHFYVTYLHPYFDGNGRTARLLQLWYLLRQGYSATLFVPFSSYIRATRSDYYKTCRLIGENQKISGVVDVTPFVTYFVKSIYNRMEFSAPSMDTLAAFADALAAGRVTAREKALWDFVLSAYSLNEFSTKQLERDFGGAAYATIRGFVMKFEELGLLQKRVYGNRPKYRVAPTAPTQR